MKGKHSEASLAGRPPQRSKWTRNRTHRVITLLPFHDNYANKVLICLLLKIYWSSKWNVFIISSTTILSGTCIITLVFETPSWNPCYRSAFGCATFNFSRPSFANTFGVLHFILNLTNFSHLSSSGRRKGCLNH